METVHWGLNQVVLWGIFIKRYKNTQCYKSIESGCCEKFTRGFKKIGLKGLSWCFKIKSKIKNIHQVELRRIKQNKIYLLGCFAVFNVW